MTPTSSQITGLLDHRPTYACVSLGALRRNFRTIKNFVGSAKILPSIKANGYGHGLTQVAQVYESEGADGLGVAFIEEALELRRAGITIPLLVFGGILRDQIQLFLDHDVDITASSISKLQYINDAAMRSGKVARVHLKIDTGLERIGVHYYNSRAIFEQALQCQNVSIVGVFSHFAAISSSDSSLGREQLSRFLESVAYYEQLSPPPFVRHIAASTGILGLKDSHLDMVRPGLILFGVYPDEGFRPILPLEPALSLKSQVVYFKVVKKGAGVSYGHRWHASEDTRIVTIPIGYGDGYMRAFSNKSHVLIRGQRCPIVGAVCMDQLMANLGPNGTGYNGDEVVLIGRQGDAEISVESLAALLETTPHEVLALLNQRIPREYSETP